MAINKSSVNMANTDMLQQKKYKKDTYNYLIDPTKIS